MWSQQPKTIAILSSSLLLLGGCGLSTIDDKPATVQETVKETVTTTVTKTQQPQPPKNETSSSPSPTTSSQTPAVTTPSKPAWPASVKEFLELLELDASYARFTHKLGPNDPKASPVYQIATGGSQRIPEHTVPPGVVLDYSPDGSYTGSETHSYMEWIDNQCGRVIRIQAGPDGGRFSGTTVTYYWSGWANPPAAPDWCH